MTEETFKQVRASTIWRDTVEPYLRDRLFYIYEELSTCEDARTITMCQGGIAEVKYLLGNPERDAIIQARIAQHKLHQPEPVDDEEEIEDGRKPGIARARKLAARRGGLGVAPAGYGDRSTR